MEGCDRHVNQPLGLCSALQSREEEKGEGGEERMGRGIRWVLQNTRPKMGKLFWSVVNVQLVLGEENDKKTSVLSKENPLFVSGLEIETLKQCILAYRLFIHSHICHDFVTDLTHLQWEWGKEILQNNYVSNKKHNHWTVSYLAYTMLIIQKPVLLL